MGKLSVQKLALITVGSIVGLIFLGALAIKISGSSNPKKIVTESYQTNLTAANNPDVAIEQLSSKLDETSAKLSQEQQGQHQDIQLLLAKINEFSQGFESLDQRISSLEGSRMPVHVKITKLKKKQRQVSRKEASKHQARIDIPKRLKAYKVYAAVGNRAWINNNGREDSLTIGDHVAPSRGSYTVEKVDSSNGIVYLTK